MNQLKYDSLYSGLVSINRSLGGYQPMPDSEYGAMIDLMETLSNRPVGESGDVFDAVSTVATMAENGELPIQGGEVPSGCRLGTEWTTVTSNGHYSWDASNYGWDGFSSFQLDVDVPGSGTGGTKIDVGELGLRFGQSTMRSVPDSLDFTNVVDMSHMFQDCNRLSTIPQLDTSNVTSMEYMFSGCSELTTIPQLDTSNVTSMEYIFNGCSKLTTIPQLDTSNVVGMSSMFHSCSNLSTIPQLDTSKVTYMSNIFQECSKLTTIPQLDTSNVTSVSKMFDACGSLESIPMLDFSKVTNISNFFGYSFMAGNYPYLTDLGGFMGLKINWNDGGGLSKCQYLTVDSLMNVINNLYDFIGNGESVTVTLQMGEINLAKLTPDQIAVATNKGWVLT